MILLIQILWHIPTSQTLILTPTFLNWLKSSLPIHLELWCGWLKRSLPMHLELWCRWMKCDEQYSFLNAPSFFPFPKENNQTLILTSPWTSTTFYPWIDACNLEIEDEMAIKSNSQFMRVINWELLLIAIPSSPPSDCMYRFISWLLSQISNQNSKWPCWHQLERATGSFAYHL